MIRPASSAAWLLVLIALPVHSEEPSPNDPAEPKTEIWSRQVRDVNVRLLDIGVDLLVAAGTSSERNDEIEKLQGGEHDPRQRGFTLQQLELSMQGAVDPYFTADAFVIWYIDPDGDSQVEIEEAFATSSQLPFGLSDLGFEIEAGTFFTEFGRINHQHPHFWSWQDAPVVHSRFLGPEGLRGPGARIGWLAPLPWYSEFHVGMQNSEGESQLSFLAGDDAFNDDGLAIGGRPFTDRDIKSTADFTYLLRWVNGFDLGDSVSSQIGASAVLGPNATGSDGETQIVGADFVLKWRPEETDRGWPFVTLQGEVMWRRYRADDFRGSIDDGNGGEVRVALPSDTLKDVGLYAEALWGFRRNWAAGLRYEYADGGSGPSYDGAQRISANADPYRSSRHRVSPLLMFLPTEFSRLRLQYNYDDDTSAPGNDAHSVWLGLEVSFGAHPAHAY